MSTQEEKIAILEAKVAQLESQLRAMHINLNRAFNVIDSNFSRLNNKRSEGFFSDFF